MDNDPTTCKYVGVKLGELGTANLMLCAWSHDVNERSLRIRSLTENSVYIIPLSMSIQCSESQKVGMSVAVIHQLNTLTGGRKGMYVQTSTGSHPIGFRRSPRHPL